jgi:hypothetical protein
MRLPLPHREVTQGNPRHVHPPEVGFRGGNGPPCDGDEWNEVRYLWRTKGSYNRDDVIATMPSRLCHHDYAIATMPRDYAIATIHVIATLNSPSFPPLHLAQV